MKKRFNLNTVYVIVALVIIGVLVVPRITEWIHLQTKGISYVADDTDEYVYTSEKVEGDYSVKLDLEDLKSNEGKELFNDGDNQIYVSEVTEKDDACTIHFQSSGDFDTGGVTTLVSGQEYPRENGDVATNLKAEAQAAHNGKTYELAPSESSGLIHHDGDEFSFALSSQDEPPDSDLKKDPTMEISITDLYINIWMKKQ